MQKASANAKATATALSAAVNLTDPAT